MRYLVQDGLYRGAGGKRLLHEMDAFYEEASFLLATFAFPQGRPSLDARIMYGSNRFSTSHHD
ncbi:thymidylate kinase [Paenibacillus popilliae ATCC 14706]|uniref:Thymidylate kinase n=1 Tax=Paenibacillus popilliae ATCC 14706 TaxID=1212764 RepID=M9LQV2_PAEPP|nr:thymidylate kinase [Paenibacillus popilliae ATCC 14706]